MDGSLSSGKSVAEGGAVRRKGADVERLIGRESFLLEARRRGVRVAEIASRFIAFCNSEPV